MQQKLEEKLQSMLNKVWMHNTFNYKLLSFKITPIEITLVTDKKWMTVPIEKINKTLSEFSPVQDLTDKPELSLMLFKSNGKQSMQDLVHENIQKIKEDPSYIPKAKALNEQIKTMIEMAKLEIELTKLKGNK